MLRQPSLYPVSPLGCARELTILIALTLVLFSGATYSQLSSASVTGVVRDPSGSRSSGACVLFINTSATDIY